MQTILYSTFIDNTAGLSLIKSFLTNMSISYANFINNNATLISSQSAVININNSIALNTDCTSSSNKGCLIDSMYCNVNINNVSMTNILINSEGGTIYARNNPWVNASYFKLNNVLGNGKGGCVLGKNTQFNFTNLNISNYKGGCIYNSKGSFYIYDSFFDNTDYSKIYTYDIIQAQSSTFICSSCPNVIISGSKFQNNIFLSNINIYVGHR